MADDHVAWARRVLAASRGAAPAGVGETGAGGGVGARVGAALDGAALTVVRRVFLAAHRRGVDDRGTGPLVSAWQRHAEAAARDPAPFFPRPVPPGVVRRARRPLPGGCREDLTFASDYAPGRDTARALARRYPDNAVARARSFRHTVPLGPAVVCLHGWAGGRYAVEAAFFKARWLYDLGLDVYLHVQPYHGPRRPRDALLRGTLHPSTNVTRTNEAFLQTAWEVRSLLAAHEAETGRGGGVLGVSLGAYGAVMLAAVAPEVEYAVAVLPVADMAALLWAQGAGTADQRRAEARGVSFESFCRLMAVHAPLARPGPAIPRERLLLVAGRGDRFVPPCHAEVLRERWGLPPVHFFPGGHLAHFGRGGYLEAVRGHLRRCGALAG